MNRLLRPFWLGACALVVAQGTAWAQDGDGVAPVRSVVLSSAGLAEFTRQAQVGGADGEGRGPLVLSVPTPVAQMDDVLKTLLVSGVGVEGVELRVDSSSAVEDVFAGLPFRPEDVAALDQLLARFPGAEVVVTTSADTDSGVRRISGRVLGVSTPDRCGEDGPCVPVLLVQGPDSALGRIELGGDVQVRLTGAAEQEAIARGVEALASSSRASARDVDVVVRRSPGAQGDVYISTVVPAPMWKSAYRAFVAPDGGAPFQAWAVVENATQEDWKDVDLTLVSGNPRTLDANLYAREYGVRGPVGPQAQAAPVFAMGRAELASLQDGAASASGAMVDYAQMGSIETGVEGTDALGGARFALPTPVSLDAGQVLSLPFLSGDLDGQAVSYARMDQVPSTGSDTRPLDMALDVRNTTASRLPAGILTVYESGQGFAGDAYVPAMEAGSQHTLVFGEDPGVRLGKREEHETVLRAIVPGDGVVRINSDRIHRQDFRVVAGPQQTARVVLDMAKPFEGAMTWTGAKATEHMLNGREEVVRVSRVMEPGSVWEFATTTTTPLWEEWAVGDVGDAQLLALASRSPNKETKAWIERAVALRGAVAAAQRSLEEERVRRARLVEDQERARETVAAVGAGTPAHDRFLTQLMEAEDAIAQADGRLVEMEKRLEAARSAFSTHISTP